MLPLLTKTRAGTTTLTNEQNREGGFIHETLKFSKTGSGATSKWLTALTTANRKKNAATFDLRGKGMHTLEVITPTLRATPLYLEMAVEATYPIAEGLTTTALTLPQNLGAFGFLVVLQLAPGLARAC